MAKKPEEWIDQQVRVGLTAPQQMRQGVGPGGEIEPSGRLIQVNESGLVLLQRVEEGDRQVFYPWGAVAYVYPLEEPAADEEQKSYSEGEPTAVTGPPSWRERYQ